MYLHCFVLFLVAVPIAAAAKSTKASAEELFPIDRELSSSRRCSAHSDCNGVYDGNCCPHDDGYYFRCCDDNPHDGTCSKNNKCYEKGYRGECCPTPKGYFLDCCDENPSDDHPPSKGTCEANKECRDKGLTGDCCPSYDSKGNEVYLDCCDYHDDGGTCYKNRGCRTEGLKGDCCPSYDKYGKEVYLDCCDKRDQPKAAQCSYNSLCKAKGLSGYCCPTSDGVFLDCCDRNPTLHSSEQKVEGFETYEVASAELSQSSSSILESHCTVLVMGLSAYFYL